MKTIETVVTSALFIAWSVALCGAQQGAVAPDAPTPAQKPTAAATAPPDAAAVAKQKDIDLAKAQIEKLQAQGALLEKTLGGITEFQEWVQVQQQLNQAQQSYQQLTAPAPKPEAPKAAPAKPGWTNPR